VTQDPTRTSGQVRTAELSFSPSTEGATRSYLASKQFRLVPGTCRSSGGRLRLRQTDCAGEAADAAVATIRLKLLKLGARVCTSVRRIHFAIASSYPNQHEFETAYLALKRTFSSA